MREIDDELHHLDCALRLVAGARPQMLLSERRKFFGSTSYEPQFQYRKIPQDDLRAIQERLKRLSIKEKQPFSALFEEKRLQLIEKTALIAAIGDDYVFPQASEQYFGIPSDTVLHKAKAELQVMGAPPHRKRPLLDEEAKEKLQRFLCGKGLSHWKVKIAKKIVSRCVIAGNATLLLRANVKYSERMIRKLIAHEIETHIYCSENGKLQPYHIFHRGLAHHLKTQEGLAIYHQNQVVSEGTRDALILFQAAHWARTMGFREVFHRLQGLVPERKAWRIAIKVKRGLSDTGKPGAFLKNALYYWGYLEIVDYLRQGGELQDLYLGKCALHQLHVIKSLPGILPPKYLPLFSEA